MAFLDIYLPGPNNPGPPQFRLSTVWPSFTNWLGSGAQQDGEGWVHCYSWWCRGWGCSLYFQHGRLWDSAPHRHANVFGIVPLTACSAVCGTPLAWQRGGNLGKQQQQWSVGGCGWWQQVVLYVLFWTIIKEKMHSVFLIDNKKLFF